MSIVYKYISRNWRKNLYPIMRNNDIIVKSRYRRD